MNYRSDVDPAAEILIKTPADALVLYPSEMRLGDRVQISSDPYGWGTVTDIDAQRVVVTRPYIHTSPFSYSGDGTPTSGKVIAYTGLETIDLPMVSSMQWVVSRPDTAPR